MDPPMVHYSFFCCVFFGVEAIKDVHRITQSTGIFPNPLIANLPCWNLGLKASRGSRVSLSGLHFKHSFIHIFKTHDTHRAFFYLLIYHDAYNHKFSSWSALIIFLAISHQALHIHIIKCITKHQESYHSIQCTCLMLKSQIIVWHHVVHIFHYKHHSFLISSFIHVISHKFPEYLCMTHNSHIEHQILMCKHMAHIILHSHVDTFSAPC